MERNKSDVFSRICIVPALLLGLAYAGAAAELRLPAIFGDHMVLQADLPVPVWGWSDPGAEITASFAGQTAKATAGKDGRWRASFTAMPASAEGRELRVKSSKDSAEKVFSDVLVGEVWICSGQSNMQMSVGGCNRADEEISSANDPQIRLFTVPNVTAPVPCDDCVGLWKVCSPETVPGFSAVGYFFGRHLKQKLNVPVGLINTSWGGTVCEAWTSADALRAKLPEFNEGIGKLTANFENMEKAKTTFKENMEKFNASLQKLYDLEDDPAGAAAKFAGADLDESDWKTMNVPANWETSPDFKNVDGIVWFRKTVEIPAAWAGKEIILRPGPIDEVDQAFFNGKQVGGKGSMRRQDVRFWNVPREYKVPGDLVKAGKGVIAIRVFDAVGQGGLWGGAPDTMFVELSDGSDKTRIPLAGPWRCKAEFVLPAKPSDFNNPNQPSVLYNAMISPLIPYAVRGAIWYQGESNAGRAKQYQTLLPAMISDWRQRWNSGEFPFLIVQLANFMDRKETPQDSNWAELREAQYLATKALPKVGLATIIDIGDAKDIHPKNKQDVGFRLGLAAQALAYNQKIEYSGPVFKEMKVEGNKAVLSFDHVGAGLVAKDGPPKGFAVAGPDKKFVWAKAEINGDKIVVSADGISAPAAVRYAWADNPDCNIYNQAGLPMVPFRTDGN